jgi:hypothetical protein
MNCDANRHVRSETSYQTTFAVEPGAENPYFTPSNRDIGHASHLVELSQSLHDELRRSVWVHVPHLHGQDPAPQCAFNPVDVLLTATEHSRERNVRAAQQVNSSPNKSLPPLALLTRQQTDKPSAAQVPRGLPRHSIFWQTVTALLHGANWRQGALRGVAHMAMSWYCGVFA